MRDDANIYNDDGSQTRAAWLRVVVGWNAFRPLSHSVLHCPLCIVTSAPNISLCVSLSPSVFLSSSSMFACVATECFMPGGFSFPFLSFFPQ